MAELEGIDGEDSSSEVPRSSEDTLDRDKDASDTGEEEQSSTDAHGPAAFQEPRL